MIRVGSAVLVALFSFSALAKVSMDEKRSRVRFLERLSQAIPALHVEGYQRELRYEEQNLPLSERAASEAQLMAEKIKLQVATAYERAMEESSDVEQAKSIVRESIDRDLELAEPLIRDSLREIAHKSLEDAANGIISSDDLDSDPLSRYMLTEVTERSSYLNSEIQRNQNENAPIASDAKDAERLRYNNKNEILSSLASERANTRWSSTASTTFKSQVTRKNESNVSYSLKINFLGADLSGGPSISFHRDYESRVVVLSEGLSPAITANGDFDFNRRDRAGNVIMTGGRAQKRFLSFFCEVSLNFNTEYSGGGSFSLMGIGGGTSYGSRFSNEVELSSRRILVPEYIGNQSVTLQTLQRICLNDFLNAKINDRMTIKQSLNVQMRNMVASLRFSHPQTKCVRDDQCVRWFNSGMRGVVGNAAVPRCVEEPREKYFACVVRSVVNQKCPVYKNGKHVSSGMFEYACDKGLYCKTVKEGGWFQSLNIFEYAEGRCTPRGR